MFSVMVRLKKQAFDFERAFFGDTLEFYLCKFLFS